MLIKNLIETTIEDILLSKDKIIRFDIDFNENIDFLEKSQIEELIFENYGKFNQPLNKLPVSLRKLKVPRNFSYKIEYFPPDLQELTICSDYNYELNNLPAGLIELYLYNDTNYNFDNLPNSLKILRAGNRDIKIIILPLNLKELILPRYHLYKIEVFPPNLEKLQLSYYYNFSLNNLPNKLIKLIIAGGPREYQDRDDNNYINYPEFNQDINNLPDSIEEIDICVTSYNLPIIKLPKNLDTIMFHVLEHVNTPDIEEINMGDIMFFCRCMSCKNNFFIERYT